MAQDSTSKAPLTILVIEDYLDTRLFLVECLRRHGYNVLEAEDGQDGLAKAQQLKPALILMDLAMPGLDGIEALRRMRRGPGLLLTPIFVMSAYLTKEVRLDALAAGCDGVFAKPLNPDALLIEIGETLAFDSGQMQ
jgi:CheY-like chemotaxis protein